MGGKVRWTEAACLAEASKYTTKSGFTKGAPGAYQKACSKGWIYDYVWLERKVKGNHVWTEERTAEESKKYRTRTEFHHGSLQAYRNAVKHGWIEGYEWLEPPRTWNGGINNKK